MRVLVTGGAGFIGSNISKYLVEKGDSVIVMDDFFSGKEENIADFKDSVELFRGSIEDLGLVRKCCENADYVLHQAAIPSVPRSVKDPIRTTNVNVIGTLNVLTAARDAGVKRVVMASSSSVYGETATLPKHEGMCPNPLSPYASSKLFNEQHARQFYQLYGLETVALRYFNVYGRNQDPASEYAAVIPKFIKAALRKERPVIYGDGEQTRDFTYIDDVVNANILAMKGGRDSAGEVFNIAGGSQTSINELWNTVKGIVGCELEPKYSEERAGDIKHSYADAKKAEKLLGFKTKYNLKEGLEKTVEWLGANL